MMHIIQRLRGRAAGQRAAARSGLCRFGKIALTACLLFSTPVTGWTGDYDGSKPLSGRTGKIIELRRQRIKEGVDPDAAGIPRSFLIDFNTRTLRPSKDSLVRKTITFKQVVHIDGTMVLQGLDSGLEGVDDALAWSLTISKKDGSAVLAATGNAVAYVVFGSCVPQNSAP